MEVEEGPEGEPERIHNPKIRKDEDETREDEDVHLGREELPPGDERA